MATEKRMIYADELVDRLYDTEFAMLCPLDEVCGVIDSTKTVDAVEVVHSQWDTVFYERNGTLASYSHLCPECKYFYRDVRFAGHRYCPNCGAKMDGERKGMVADIGEVKRHIKPKADSTLRNMRKNDLILSMANVIKYGYFKPVKKNYSPIRWVPGKKVPNCGEKKTG